MVTIWSYITEFRIQMKTYMNIYSFKNRIEVYCKYINAKYSYFLSLFLSYSFLVIVASAFA